MIVITGIGISSAIGCTMPAFTDALLKGKQAFSYLTRAGRQTQETAFIGAEIQEPVQTGQFNPRLLRDAGLSAKVGISTCMEAWEDAQLNGVDPERIGLIIGGSNFQQREQLLFKEAYRERLEFINPSYAMTYLDYDLASIITAQFGIHAFAYTIGGTFASGQLAVIQAAKAVESGVVDICIAVGALMDVSYWELQAYKAVGAMGSHYFADNPACACRPFDAYSDGFIYGEACGVVVVESAASADKRKVSNYGQLSGWAIKMDGNRGLSPALSSECDVIRAALRGAGLESHQIDYINPHGSGSPLGDLTEANAIFECGLSHAWINTTKSITGHTMTAAGITELIALLLQMKAETLHPCRNLNNPVHPGLNWTGTIAKKSSISNAINISIGPGGINTAICVQNINT